DGYGTSAPATVTVHVSAAPLVHLDFQQRTPRLNRGDIRKVTFVGDFADQSGVVLAPSYVTFQSTSPAVASVSPAGQLSALADGTVNRGPAETVVPVKVEAPRPGPATVDGAGGIVRGADGSLVMLAPGALPKAAQVSIVPLTMADMPMPVPHGFQFGGAFHLEVGDDPLNLRAQLVIPVAPGVPAGTPVYFMRAGELPDITGQAQPYWLQVEN